MRKTAHTNFRYFEGIEKYQSEVSILRYRYQSLVSKLGIENYRFFTMGIMVRYRKLLIPEFSIETRY